MTAKLSSPAAERNASHIAAVLDGRLPTTGVVLEIASGSGYHTVAFATRFDHLVWQPTDLDPAARASIEAYIAESGLNNINPPMALDVLQNPWPVAQADFVICINMIHISPWEATPALFDGAATLLRKGAMLFTYGPYILRGDFLSESNVEFDQSLRARNPAWGLREVSAVETEATTAGFKLVDVVRMPANNLSLFWERQ
jgi:cyclopropane fatty-acyl-phospholipid synthase-like methyltransferase